MTAPLLELERARRYRIVFRDYDTIEVEAETFETFEGVLYFRDLDGTSLLVVPVDLIARVETLRVPDAVEVES